MPRTITESPRGTFTINTQITERPRGTFNLVNTAITVSPRGTFTLSEVEGGFRGPLVQRTGFWAVDIGGELYVVTDFGGIQPSNGKFVTVVENEESLAQTWQTGFAGRFSGSITGGAGVLASFATAISAYQSAATAAYSTALAAVNAAFGGGVSSLGASAGLSSAMSSAGTGAAVTASSVALPITTIIALAVAFGTSTQTVNIQALLGSANLAESILRDYGQSVTGSSNLAVGDRIPPSLNLYEGTLTTGGRSRTGRVRYNENPGPNNHPIEFTMTSATASAVSGYISGLYERIDRLFSGIDIYRLPTVRIIGE